MKNLLSRRNFLRKTSKGLAGAAAVSAVGSTSLYGNILKNADTPAVLGGTPVRTKPLSVEWPIYDDSDVKLYLEAFHSKKWCSLGSPLGTMFEEKWAKLNNVPYCITTANGTSALYSSLIALGVGTGDEVIVPPYTYSASYEAIFMLNALGVFVDIDPKTYKINPDLIEERINEHTKAIMPVHIGGAAADMDKIMAISKKYNIPVVEDACQAWLGEWRGKKFGSVGDTGCFSFNYYKNICSGEGGAIIGSNPEVMDMCDSIVNDGRYSRIPRSKLSQGKTESLIAGKPYGGMNFRLTELQSGVLLGQVQRIEKHQKIRNENFSYLDKLLKEVPGISQVDIYEGQTMHGCHLYKVIYDKKHFNGLSRSSFAKAAQAEGIDIGAGYGKANLSDQIEYHLNSRSFKAVFPKERLDNYRKNNYCPANDIVATETGLWMEHMMFLCPRKDMEDIAEAFAKVQKNSAELVKKM